MKSANRTGLFLCAFLPFFLLIAPGCGGGSRSGGLTPTDLAISPISPTIPVGGQVPFKATTHLSDGTSRDVTANASWSSSVTSVATIDNLGTTVGLAHGVAPGTTTITASSAQGFSTISSSTALTVMAVATPTELDILPISPSIEVGDFQQFTALAHFSDGSTQNVTDKADWSSSALDIADIESTFDIGPGLAQGKAAGMTTITVSFTQGSNLVMSSTVLTVTAGASKAQAPQMSDDGILPC